MPGLGTFFIIAPEQAHAAGYTIDVSGSPESGIGYTWDSTTKIITFNSAANSHSYTLIRTGGQNINGIDIADGTNTKITLSKLTLSTDRSPIALLGNAKLELTLSGENSLTATGYDSAEINVTINAALTIKGNGSITVIGGRNGAGIGGGEYQGAGTILSRLRRTAGLILTSHLRQAGSLTRTE